MRPVDFLPAARIDFDQAFDWYSKRSQLAADRFETAVNVSLRSIAVDPERFAVVRPHYHGCRVERFPYRLIYQIEPTRILVVAVAHAKRRPGYWKHRT